MPEMRSEIPLEVVGLDRADIVRNIGARVMDMAAAVPVDGGSRPRQGGSRYWTLSRRKCLCCGTNASYLHDGCVSALEPAKECAVVGPKCAAIA
jgi:hypothetical protein